MFQSRDATALPRVMERILKEVPDNKLEKKYSWCLCCLVGLVRSVKRQQIKGRVFIKI